MAIQTISVTQLKCACLDPEWWKKWLRGENPSTAFFAPPGTVPVYGTIFHKIAEDYVGWLTSAKDRDVTGKLTDADALWHEMYERFAEKRLTELLKSGKIESAYHLGKALKAFCAHVTGLRKRTLDFQTWQDLYLTKEFSVKDIRFNVGENSIFVSGQIDAIRTHPEYGLEIVDYKLSRGTNMKHDLLQVAIYAKLLAIVKPGLTFHGVLEYYEPELYEVPVTTEELDAIFQELVEPIFSELRNQESEVRSQKSGVQGSLAEAIRKCYADFKLNIEVIDKHEAPQLIRYKVRPAPGVKVVSLANRAEDLQVALSLPQPPFIEPAQGYVTIDIPKEEPDMVFWRDVVKDPAYSEHSSTVAFPLGIGVESQVVVADFADPNMCHALVAGASGSGKSEFLKSLVASLIIKNSPHSLKLLIIDPKILTFGAFSDCPYLTYPIITDIFSAIPSLREVAEEMEMRYQQLADEGFENLSDRIQAGKHEIPFYVIVFDEFADLILAGGKEKKEFENLVKRLTAKGRAAGIHLVLTTQRPDREIVTGLIKANMPLKICLRVTTGVNSKIILDQTGGESLLGRGDLLCDRGKGTERVQSPYIPKEALSEVASGGKP